MLIFCTKKAVILISSDRPERINIFGCNVTHTTQRHAPVVVVYARNCSEQGPRAATINRYGLKDFSKWNETLACFSGAIRIPYSLLTATAIMVFENHALSVESRHILSTGANRNLIGDRGDVGFTQYTVHSFALRPSGCEPPRARIGNSVIYRGWRTLLLTCPIKLPFLV